MNQPRGLARFLESAPVYALFAAALACALVLGVVALVLGRNEVPPRELADTYSALGSLLQGIVGSAVALAGSLVAIFLAVLGLRIVREQEAREQEAYLRTYLTDALTPIKRVALELGALVARYLALAELTRQAGPALAVGESEVAAATEQGRRAAAFVAGVGALAEALEAVALDPRASHLWGATQRGARGLMSQLQERRGMAASPANPSQLARYLRLRGDLWDEAWRLSTAADAWQRELAGWDSLAERSALHGAWERHLFGAGCTLHWVSTAGGAHAQGLAALVDVWGGLPAEADLARFLEEDLWGTMAPETRSRRTLDRLRQFIRHNAPTDLLHPDLAAGARRASAAGIAGLIFERPGSPAGAGGEAPLR